MEPRTVLPRSRNAFVQAGLFVLFALAGAVQILEVHTHHGVILGLAYMLFLAVVVAVLYFGPLPAVARHALATPALFLGLIALLAVADQRHYAKVIKLPEPMTTSIALEVPARLLVHGHDPYSQTAHGAPISPGPGWWILLSPLTIPGWTGLIGVIALAVTYLALYRRDPTAAGVFCLLMLLQPLLESQMANGQDLFDISFALIFLALLLEQYAISAVHVTWLALLAGVIATSRVPMVAILCVLAFGLWVRNRRTGAIFAVVMLSTAFALHGGFAVWAHHDGLRYQPMHVLGRATQEASLSRFIAPLLAIASLLWIYLDRGATAGKWLFNMFLVMAALFGTAGMKELFVFRRFDWEGATYVSFPIPLLTAALVLMAAEWRRTKASAQV